LRPFLSQLENRRPDLPLLVTERGILKLSDLKPGPNKIMAQSGDVVSARVALSLHAPEALLAALAYLDGRAEAMLHISPTLPPKLVTGLVTAAGCNYLISDRDDLSGAAPLETLASLSLRPALRETEWIMTTSGTTGQPKMVRHCLSSLARTVTPMADLASRPVWGLTYEPTRFAGMQVLLQACLGEGVLVAPKLGSDIGAILNFFADHNCSHISATPTLWRRFLMHPNVARLALSQITLGGEIVGQALLNALVAQFPTARITHVYASTEAGVGFSVHDRREGFPESIVANPPKGVGIAIREGRLWLRPESTASEYLGEQRLPRASDGFIDTGDRVTWRDNRYIFLGRDTGTINIGGVKVNPEEIERVIATLDGVAMVSVTAKSSSLVGAMVTAQIVSSGPVVDESAFLARVFAYCRANLAREAVPATIRLVDRLVTNSAGKIQRN